MPEKVLKSIKPREYQKNIFEKCKEKNCLVVLPTGIGKTLIALMLSIHTQKKFPASKTLFLAPTRPLAEQHLAYFKKHLPELFAELNLFTGKINANKRKELWETSEIIFSTPQCVSNDVKNNLYNLEDVSLLIEDECVTGDTKLKLNEGSLRKIEEVWKSFKLGSNIYVESLSESGNQEPQKILNVHRIKNKKKLLKIKTETNEIKLTEDHKLVLKRGLNYIWAEAKDLKEGDRIALEKVYKLNYKNRVIVNEKSIKDDYKKNNETINAKIIKRLKEKKLLPLKYSNSKLKIISRLFGFVFGDGWFTKIKEKPKIIGFSGKIEDLEKVQKDLSIIGAKYPCIVTKKTNSIINTWANNALYVNGITNSFNVTDSALAKLFEILKMPIGDKTINPFLLPQWLMESPKFIKKEFLSALMGCEGDVPKFKKNLRSPYAIRFRFNKINSLKNNALRYADQIRNLLKEFDVQSTIQIKKGNIRKDKQKTIQIQITISNSNENIYKFLQEIGYEYNYKKIKEANTVLNYLKYKDEELYKRDFFYKEILKLKKKGFNIHRAIQKISKKFKVKQTEIWSLGYSNKASHSSWLIKSYDEWKKNNKPDLNVRWEKIKQIKQGDNEKYTYDITVEKNHNYIGNGFIVHNCHRCLKNYSYTYVAQKYLEQAKNQRVLGLTASPGVDKKTIQEIAKNLGIETIEVRTRDSVDVKEYLQELEFVIVKIEFPEEIKEIVDIIRKLYSKKVEELKNRKLLFEPPTKTNLLKLQGKLMSMISSGNNHFNLLSGVSACAQAIKLSHLIELLETQTLHTSINYIKSMFEQAKENRSKAVKQIVKNSEFNSAYIKLNELVSKNIEHPKLKKLKEIIQEQIKENPNNKTIIFSQYRDTVVKINKELSQIPNIKAKVFVGQSKKKDSGLSQKEQQEIMREFKEGIINVVVATSIGEEGLDIPEVNSVIFYEPIPSAIRKIQRAGRTARLMKGKLIILLTEDTLDEIFYYASIGKEKKMYRSLESIKKDLENGKSLVPDEDKTQNSERILKEKRDLENGKSLVPNEDKSQNSERILNENNDKNQKKLEFF